MTNQRWDTDQKGSGIGSARQQTSAVVALVEAMQLPDWVAEEPEHHLLPHLQAACARSGSPWHLHESHLDGVVFVVELEWHRPAGQLRQLTADAYALIGLIAESNSHIRQDTGEDYVDFEVTTGMLDGDGHYKGHGHLILLRAKGEAVSELIQRHRV